VWEWTCSAYDGTYGGGERRRATGGAGRRALRGGSWYDRPELVRSANREPRRERPGPPPLPLRWFSACAGLIFSALCTFSLTLFGPRQRRLRIFRSGPYEPVGTGQQASSHFLHFFLLVQPSRLS
jgi:hypothetical protein